MKYFHTFVEVLEPWDLTQYAIAVLWQGDSDLTACLAREFC